MIGRPEKEGVNYFPHLVKHGETMYLLEKTYGNDGYAAWFKTLEALGSKPTLSLNCNGNSPSWEYLKAKTSLSEEKLNAILNLLAALEAIDTELWEQNRIIWSQNFVENLKPVYAKRKKEIPLKPILRDRKADEGHFPGLSDAENSQYSKGKESREKKRREKNTFLSDSDELRLAEFLYEKILENNPKTKKPNLQVWAKHIDLAIREDNRTAEDLRILIEWSQVDPFWKLNILSTQKLRDKFDQLWVKMTASSKGRGPQFLSEKGQRTLDNVKDVKFGGESADD